MASRTQTVTQEEIGATTATICAEASGDATWLSSFTIDQNSLYEDEVFLSHNPTCKTVDLAQAQDRDQNIKRIQDIIGSQEIPILTERRRETAEVRRFL